MHITSKFSFFVVVIVFSVLICRRYIFKLPLFGHLMSVGDLESLDIVSIVNRIYSNIVIKTNNNKNTVD